MMMTRQGNEKKDGKIKVLDQGLAICEKKRLNMEIYFDSSAHSPEN